MITIEQIKELMAKATPGKWLLVGNKKFPNSIGKVVSKGRTNGLRMPQKIFNFSAHCSYEDAKFIAALPEIAQLCLDQAEEIERLREFEWKYNDLCK